MLGRKTRLFGCELYLVLGVEEELPALLLPSRTLGRV